MDQRHEDVVVGRRLNVQERLVRRKDGRSEAKQMVVHPGSVVLLPRLDDGRIVLIRNHRFTVGRKLLELPAGTREPGEEPAVCAARELEEETGYVAGELEELLAFYPSPGTSDERMHVYLADQLTPTSQRLDPSEDIQVAPLALSEALECVRNREIEDAKTIAALLYFHAFRASAAR